MTNLEKLQGLYLTNNNIEGSIPTNIGNLKSLRQLRLQNNKIAGEIPASLGDLDSIFIIYFHNNRLSGCYHENLLNLCDVGEFRLPNNENLPWAGDFTKFCETDGSIESQKGYYCGLGGAGILDDCECIVSNELCYTPDYLLCQDWLQAEIASQGCYDFGFGNRRNYTIGVSKYLDDPVVTFQIGAEIASEVVSTRIVFTCDGELLESCSFSLGTNCPDSITIYSQLFIPPTAFYRCMEDDLTDCSMFDQYPDYEALSSLFYATNGLDWTNQEGWRDGMQDPYNDPCEWVGVTCAEGRVTSLVLSSNNLDGQIPAEIGELDKLKFLLFTDNNLSGSIPDAIGELPELQSFSIFGNNISGEIPTSLGQLSKLKTLIFAKNNLTESIPASLGDIPFLDDVNLSENQLTGSLPIEFAQLEFMQSLYLSDNNLTGPIPDEFSNMDGLHYLYLHNNQFDGSLDFAFSNNTELISITLDNNNFTGTIPHWLTENKDLAKIELQNNMFDGEVPVSFGQLNSLIEFNIDNNKLSGCYPEDMKNLCDIEASSTGNLLMPWMGDFDEFCNVGGSAMTQWGATCDDGDDSNGTQDIIREDCSCGPEIVSTNDIEDDYFSIYPNPATSLVHIECTNCNADIKISIYSANGKRLRQSNWFGVTKEIDISNLTSGLYLLEITTGDKKYIEKLIVDK